MGGRPVGVVRMRERRCRAGGGGGTERCLRSRRPECRLAVLVILAGVRGERADDGGIADRLRGNGRGGGGWRAPRRLPGGAVRPKERVLPRVGKHKSRSRR